MVLWRSGDHGSRRAEPVLVPQRHFIRGDCDLDLAGGQREGKAAREDRNKLCAPAIAARKAGAPIKAPHLLVEAVFQLPPGGLDREPQELQKSCDDNARIVPLMFAAPPPPAITCDMLRSFTQPML